MKVIIAGSRTIEDYDLLVRFMIETRLSNKITEVFSGGAKGVDTMGIRWARGNGKKVRMFIPDWHEYGKAAGPIRNQEMAEEADALILVWDGVSRGSLSMLTIAKKLGLPIYEYNLLKQTTNV